jgi:two-component system, chemotaxis family, chemotaxis protein CheY
MSRPTNALIVDDEAHVRMFLRLLLKELGIASTWEAGDGAAAVDLTVRHKPELVLLDINLPVMNGLQALAQLRELEPDIPVIMVTSQTALGSVQQAVRLGAIGYVLKHVPKNEALKLLREALDSLE